MTKYRVGFTHTVSPVPGNSAPFLHSCAQLLGVNLVPGKARGKIEIALLSKTLQVTENWIEESILIILR